MLEPPLDPPLASLNPPDELPPLFPLEPPAPLLLPEADPPLLLPDADPPLLLPDVDPLLLLPDVDPLLLLLEPPPSLLLTEPAPLLLPIDPDSPLATSEPASLVAEGADAPPHPSIDIAKRSLHACNPGLPRMLDLSIEGGALPSMVDVSRSRPVPVGPVHPHAAATHVPRAPSPRGAACKKNHLICRRLA
jgi:hypothetical protein